MCTVVFMRSFPQEPERLRATDPDIPMVHSLNLLLVCFLILEHFSTYIPAQ